ncbi:DNA-directed RNA polymerase [Tulasnella sp. 419]|nr:DNA-directed RNA polymerase [Tulasnella sp. 419]
MARTYSKPSAPAQAEAVAAATHIASDMPPPAPYSIPRDNLPLFGPRPLTVLRPPRPADDTFESLDPLYLPSYVYTSQALIQACIHDLHDPLRARKLFDQARVRAEHRAGLSIDLYNSMLSTYLAMRSKGSKNWLEDMWALYDDLMIGDEPVSADTQTFSIALSALQRFPEECSSLGKTADKLLADIMKSHPRPSMAQVLSPSMFASAAELAEATKIMFNATAVSPYKDAAAEMIALTKIDDSPLPEPKPVRKLKSAKDGQTDGTSDTRLKFGDNLEARQLSMEESVLESARERWAKEREAISKYLPPGQGDSTLKGWLWNWYTALSNRMEDDFADMVKQAKAEAAGTKLPSGSSSTKAQPASYLIPFLSLLGPKNLAMITLLEMIRLYSTVDVDEGLKTSRALISLGKAIENEHQARILRRHKISLSSPGTLSASGMQKLIERRSKAKAAQNEAGTAKILDWTHQIRVDVGSWCMDRMMDMTTVVRSKTLEDGTVYTEEQPAFTHDYDYYRGMKQGVIRPNPAVSEAFAKESMHEFIHPRQLPMLVTPLPWTSDIQGGYLTGRNHVMRVKDSKEQNLFLKQACQGKRLEEVFQALDVLGSTPWVINKAVLEVVLEAWNSGEALASIPPVKIDDTPPAKPDPDSTDMKAKIAYSTAVRAFEHAKRNNHSERCSMNYKIDIARAFVNDTIYFPHNVDFRGRAYPMPPHLSHVGDDLSRGLLKFAEAKPLGVRGLRWLKIHLANVFGNDKGSFDDRERFAEEHMEDIFDSANNPLNGRRWWLKSDDPWQCLATCFELRDALTSKNPLEFLSNLPVHQDGTCNGLQHYAALGGDAAGAAQVNLDVTDRPSDVYTHVANMVEEILIKEAEEGVEAAKLLKGKIARKVVKQTVMTTVYGVTLVGARAQIEKQLRDRDDIPQAMCYGAASYLARKVFQCIGTLFSGANSIQTWLAQSAKVISRSIPKSRLAELNGEVQPTYRIHEKIGRKKKLVTFGTVKNMAKEQMTSVAWTTLLGLPIVQPYRKPKRKQIYTSIQTVFISDPDLPSEVNPLKQASAFPPNFIHSLDATHMMLTALEMSNRNLSFASVHDSYWTHPCGVDEMSTIIRDTFVALHSEDVLKLLRDEFLQRYEDHVIPVSSLKHHERDEILMRSDVPREVKAKLMRDVRVRRRTPVILEDSKSELADEAVEAEAEAGEKDSTGPGRKIDMAKEKWLEFKWYLPPLPKKGDFDVRRTKESPYFFS